MKYVSTRGGIAPIGFSEAVMTGLASDGGLIVPETVPDVTREMDGWKDLEYRELAFEIMRLYADLPESDLNSLVLKSYSAFGHREITPLTDLGSIHVLELFHGPTLSFKDIALQFLGNVFEHLLAATGSRINILGATSGDTGSAAIHGVRGKDRLAIFMMHPKGRISVTQERQMTTVTDGNVFNIAIEGTFDDCQTVMKSIFKDLEFKRRYGLSAVNSINWARILAQIVYYFYAAFRVMKKTGAARVRFAVPTGNFGDIFAGYMAWRMGLPVGRLVLATNENDILSRFFNTGIYARGDVKATISPAMDIQIASNFERYLYFRAGEDHAKLREMMAQFDSAGRLEMGTDAAGIVDPVFAAGSADTEMTLDTIRRVYMESGVLLDPHTAVGAAVSSDHLKADEPMICLATAHPAKFAESVSRAVHDGRPGHPAIDALSGLPTRCGTLPVSVEAVKGFIESKAVPAE